MMNRLFFQFINQKNRLILYRLLSDLIDDGIPVFDALVLVKNEGGQSVYGRNFIKSLDRIIFNMKTVSSVTKALDGIIPPQDLTVLNAAEQSGQLSNGLRMLVSMIEKNNNISSLLKKSLLTPTILVIVVLFVIMGYSLQVFPTFLGVLPITQWPEVTRALYTFGIYLSNGGLITIFISSIVIGFFVWISMPLMSGKVRNEMLDKIPPYNYYKEIQVGLFLRMLSTLMLNGVPMVDSISLIQERASIWLKSHLSLFETNMKKGVSYKEALNTGFLTNEMLLTIALYANLDSFSLTVKKMSDISEIKIIGDIEKLSGILKNISLIMLAGSVIWIFGAIFSLVDKLGSGF